MMSASSSVGDMIEESNASMTQDGLKEESDNESSVTINTTSSFGDDYASQNNQSISGGSDNIDSENKAAYKALLEQMAANEREKRRIVEEQAAAQYDEVCKSISQNLSSDLKSAQNSYTNTINSISRPSFGGCPAMTQAKNNYESSIKAIKSKYLDQWQSSGCQGESY